MILNPREFEGTWQLHLRIEDLVPVQISVCFLEDLLLSDRGVWVLEHLHYRGLTVGALSLVGVLFLSALGFDQDVRVLGLVHDLRFVFVEARVVKHPQVRAIVFIGLVSRVYEALLVH